MRARVNMSWGGPAKASAKRTELYADKTRPPMVKLFNFWHFMTLALICDIKWFM